MIEWVDIPGYNGKYQANLYGQIRSTGARSKILRPIDLKGYCRVSLGKNHKQLVHRLIALTFIPNPKNKPEVNHKDGVKVNNCIHNLEWVTKAENAQHGIDIGIKPMPNQVGDNHSQARITSREAYLVKLAWCRCDKKRGSKLFISQVLGIPVQIVRDILSGKSWKHVNLTQVPQTDSDKV